MNGSDIEIIELFSFVLSLSKHERYSLGTFHLGNLYRAKQRVNIDFPLPLLQQIDGEGQRLGVTREAWIKMACDERMRQIATRPRQRRAS